MLPCDSGMSFASVTKWGGRTQIKFSQFSHGWKNEFEATGARGGGGREKSLLGPILSCEDAMVISPNVWFEVLKTVGSHTKGEARGSCPCRSMILSGKEVGLRRSMGVALVIEVARARAERIAVKNFMVRWGLSWLTSKVTARVWMKGDQSRYCLGGIEMEKGQGVSLFMGDCTGRGLHWVRLNGTESVIAGGGAAIQVGTQQCPCPPPIA